VKLGAGRKQSAKRLPSRYARIDAVGGAHNRPTIGPFEAMARALRAYVTAHPGRYSATIGAEFTGFDDPLLREGTRVIELIAAVLRGYGIGENDMVHAIRVVRCTLHGFAVLQATNAFQWSGDIDDSFEALIAFIHRGLGGT
jgi:Tetracyclin repressor-like, C-terminal domain